MLSIGCSYEYVCVIKAKLEQYNLEVHPYYFVDSTHTKSYIT